MSRPTQDEAAAYYFTYIDKIEGDDIVSALEKGQNNMVAFMEGLSAEKWEYAYAPGKWTLKEVCLHIIDAERVFAYRALRIARGDQTPMPGFEQDDYVPASNAAGRSAASVIAEYKAVRLATLELFRNFTPEMLSRVGTASGMPVTPNALGFIIPGHEAHHLKVNHERYF